MTPRILVTGGCGFVGTALCHALVRDGYQLRVLDNLSAGCATALPPGAEMYIGDVCNPEAVAAACTDVDLVVHLAAIPSVGGGGCDPGRASMTNLAGSVSVFSAAGARPVIFVSSAAIYGEGDGGPRTEAGPVNPISAYGIDKLASEQHLRLQRQGSGGRALILRPFNIFGRGQSAGSPYAGVVARFATRAQLGQPLVIFGDGGQTRDFVHVDDVARAMRLGIERLLRAPSGYCETVNICSGSAHSIRDVAQMMNRLTGNTAPLLYKSAKPADIRYSVGDPATAARVLEFRARTTFEQGVRGWLSKKAAAVQQPYQAAQPRSA